MINRESGPLREPYERLKLAARKNLMSGETTACLSELIATSLNYLEANARRVKLVSRVPDKRYFAFATRSRPDVLSRPVNKALFINNPSVVVEQWKKWAEGAGQAAGTEGLSYTMGTAYSIASDLFDRNNKKGPATYFEILVGHLFARAVGANPTRQVKLPLHDRSISMTMDFLFDVGSERPKIHLPVKLSTRERVVQAWAHQRLLDAAYGHLRYRGILIVHSDTKLDLRTREVVEICVPDQWLAYQKFLSKMDRIYYFDVPDRYARLASKYPEDVPLKQFSAFFSEKEALLMAPLAPPP